MKKNKSDNEMKSDWKVLEIDCTSLEVDWSSLEAEWEVPDFEWEVPDFEWEVPELEWNNINNDESPSSSQISTKKKRGKDK